MRLSADNLSLNLTGNDVKLLHIELRRLDYEITPQELDSATFDKSTYMAVWEFQKSQNLEATGVVERATVDAINQALIYRGLKPYDSLADASPGPSPSRPLSHYTFGAGEPPGFIIQGQVLLPNGTPYAGVTVRAVDRDLRSEQPLGSSTTDAEGRYSISYTAAQFSRAEKKGADLIVRVVSSDGQVLAASPIRFHASDVETIDLQVNQADVQELTEYERLVSAIQPALEGVPFHELTKDDLEFLILEAEVDGDLLEVLVVSAQNSRESGLPTEVFYGLARVGQPSQLRALIAVPVDTLRGALKEAAAARIIPARFVDELKPPAEIPAMAAYFEQARVFEVASIAKLDVKVAERVADEVGTPRALGSTTLKRLVAEKKLTQEQAAELGFASALYAIADDNAPLAGAMRNLDDASFGGRKPSSTADLASLRAADWNTVLAGAKVALPDGVTQDHAAQVLADRFATLHPAEAFVGRLPKSNQETIASQVQTLKPLFKRNTRVVGLEFDALDTTSLSGSELQQQQTSHASLRSMAMAYPALRLEEVMDSPDLSAKDKAVTVSRRVSLVDYALRHAGSNLLAVDFTSESDLQQIALDGMDDAEEGEKAMVLSTLKTYQRTYTLTQHVDDAHQLMQKGFYSSKDVAEKNFEQFRDVSGIAGDRARHYWNSAREGLMDGSLILSALFDLKWGLFDQTKVNNVRTGVEDYLRQLDGYQTLFGNLSYCACEHCQSILGPAAYFVDLMNFVQQHIRPQFGTRSDHVLELRNRRPDLWTLELTCANTNDRVPTLDIVNEILENFLARRRGYSGDLRDRAAVRQRVYAPSEQDGSRIPPSLLNAVASFSQPFHLPLARIDQYLSKLDSSRADIARALHLSGREAATATLRLTGPEWDLISRAKSSLADLSALYGIAFTATDGVVNEVEAVDLLRRTGLTREELGSALETAFVQAGGALSIQPGKRDAGSVQNDVETVRGLTINALDRLHRFVRLWRKLPWTIGELDRVLTALDVTELGDNQLIAIAAARDAQERLHVTPDELCGLCGLLPRLPDGNSLFERLFNPPSLVGTQAALPQPGTRFVHPAFSATPSLSTDLMLSRLLLGLGLDLDGLGRLCRFLAPNDKERAVILSEENLTLLYRHARLARALGVSIDALFQLIRFTGLPRGVTKLTGLLSLLEFHRWWKESGYSLDDVAVTTGLAAPLDPARYPNARALAAKVLEGIVDALSFSDTVFAAVPGATEKDSRALIAANTLILTDVGSGKWRLNDGLDLTSASTQIASSIPTVVSVDTVRGILSAYQPGEVLLRRLAAVLNTDLGKMRGLVSLTGLSLNTDALSRAVRAERPSPPAGEPLVALIEALLPLSVAFQARAWDGESVELVQSHREAFGLPAAGQPVLPLPIAALQSFSAYARLATRRQSEASDAPTASIGDLRTALEAYVSTAARFAETADAPLARALGISSGVLHGIRDSISPIRPAVVALKALADAALLARTLGIDGNTFAHCTRSQDEDFALIETVAEALVMAYASKFGKEAERKQQLSVLEEPIRERKRDALVAWLLFSLEPRPFNTANELYAHFLIDVEAGGCSTTSRVVSATSSVQLYVHRIVMNLEQDRWGVSDRQHVHLHMPAQAAAEWSWRRNYRVWEANRKVFLWPENYIEPDLRDDKSPLFKELESELLQTDVTNQNVLDAYTRYLKGFEDLASLNIAGAYQDIQKTQQTLANGRVVEVVTSDVLHLFGVTSTEPPIYYYRTCKDLKASGKNPRKAAIWSPWQKIDVQITGRRVSPVVFNGRLHVFWTSFTTRPVNIVKEGNSKFAGYQHTMAVKFTTLRADGTWSAPQPVELPDHRNQPPELRYFGPGRGGISDMLLPGGRVTKLGCVHQTMEPIDDYTLTGPNWEGLWLEPVSRDGYSAEQILTVSLRNFRQTGTVDILRRVLATGREVAEVTQWRLTPSQPPQVLLSDPSGLWYGFHDRQLSRYWGVNRAANYSIHRSRFDVVREEWNHSADWEALRREKIADQLPAETSLLAIPGSVEDAILQVGSDVILLQGSVTDNNNYVVRRIGTTLGEEVSRRLFSEELDGLLKTQTQQDLREAGLPLTQCNNRLVPRIVNDKLDLQGAYGVYYREIFFHIPFLIANALNAKGRFAEAQRWYHYIFDPTATEVIGVDGSVSPNERARRLLDRVWRYVDFRNLDATRMRDILTNEAALAAYREDPFNPHAIARVRPSAYQKAVVMKYVDNLLDWADQLFGQFTTESVNEAMMLYIMASDILGPRPAQLGDCGEGQEHPITYEGIGSLPDRAHEILLELESWTIGKRIQELRPQMRGLQPGLEETQLVHALDINPLKPWLEGIGPNAFEDAEEVPHEAKRTSANAGTFNGRMPGKTLTGGWGPSLGTSRTKTGKRGLDQVSDPPGRFEKTDWVGGYGFSIVRQVSPVFCIPANKDLLAYWDRVADRLYKIRHCMDINGQRRELALFAPEIDPALLVRMKAAGLTLEDVLGGTSGELPPYRFLYLVDRAKAFAASLSSFGAALLSAMEKRDSEEMNRLRLVHQQNLNKLSWQLRQWDIQTAEDSKLALERQKAAAETRRDFYQALSSSNLNPSENTQQGARTLASTIYVNESIIQLVAGMAGLLPQIGSPFAMTFGGKQVSTSYGRVAASINAYAKGAEAVAASSGLESGFQRRREGWDHQKQLADHDIAILNKQIEAADIRIKIAQKSLVLHEKSTEQLDEVLELMDGKFTNVGLYTKLSTELCKLYREAYQNALSMARLADQAFRFERGDESSPGLTAKHWDPSRAGLLAGEQLLIDLQNLERRFIETNHRSLEVDQAFALSQIAPRALIELRENGLCTFEVPEVFFDLTYPGHYKRRIKAVRLTVPCITGPYVNVSATLTLTGSKLRPTAVLDKELVMVPPRRSVSVATSTAQNDAGVFELSFRDERYMPFEGAGAISTWELRLPKTFRQFDYQTINDVILSISYTAEQDGVLRERAEDKNAELKGAIFHYLKHNVVARTFSLRQDFSSAFTRLLNGVVGTSVSITIEDRHFPSFLRGQPIDVRTAMILLRTNGTPPDGFSLTVDTENYALIGATGRPGNLPGMDLNDEFRKNLQQKHTLAVNAVGNLAPDGESGDTSTLDPDKLLDILLYVEYTLGSTSAPPTP